MKTIPFGAAQSGFGQLFDEVLGGQPVVVVRGRRRVLLRACGSAGQEREWAEFCAAFPPAPPEPAGGAGRVSRVIQRVRRNS